MIRSSPSVPAPPSPTGAAPERVDPFDVAPRAVSREVLADLRRAGGFEPVSASPLASFAAGGGGLPVSDASPAEDLADQDFLASLHLLANPELRLRVGLASPGAVAREGGPSIRLAHLYVRGSRVVRCEESADRVWIGPPLRLNDLVETLKELLSSRPLVESAGEPAVLALWPIIADLAKILWPSGRGHPIRRRHALLRLDHAVHDPALARRLLGALGESGIVLEAAGRISLSSAYRPWIEALFSGHRVEIERVELLSEAPRSEERALFVGWPGRRVQLEEVSHQDLEALAVPGVAGPAGLSEDCLLLTHLPDPALEARLIELVTVPSSRDPAG
ncbi:MAG: hypothetical protein AAF481_11940 [Acidobacteriota bacterium]